MKYAIYRLAPVSQGLVARLKLSVWGVGIVLGCGFGCCVIAADTDGSVAGVGGPDITTVEAVADFQVLKRAIEEMHGGLNRYNSEEQVDRLFAAGLAEANSVRSRREFIGLVSGLLASLGDGHLRLQYDEQTEAILAEAHLFPFGVAIEDGSLRVVWNDSVGGSDVMPGDEIVSVNGRSAAGLIAFMQEKLPGDGAIQTRRRLMLGRDFAELYWMFVDTTDRFEVTARNRNGVSFDVVVRGVTRMDRPENRAANSVNSTMRMGTGRMAGSDEDISVSFLAEDQIAYLQVRAFQGTGFPSRLADAIQSVHDRDSPALILDLRGNSGGADEYGALLVSQFMDRSFRYFDRIELRTIAPSFADWPPERYTALRDYTELHDDGWYRLTSEAHDGIVAQDPADRPYLKPLFVLIDGWVFSTAADVAAQLRHQQRAVFIGEESGGGFAGNTSGLVVPLQLPNSGIRVRIPLLNYWNAVEFGQDDRGVLPDFPVGSSVRDRMAGKDRPLDRAIELAQAAIRDAP